LLDGSQHQFKVSGLDVMAVGIKQATGVGNVYHLRNVADFEGKYVRAAAGVAVGGGAAATTMRNDAEHGQRAANACVHCHGWVLASPEGGRGRVETPFSGTEGELPRIRVAVPGRRDQSYRSWHERGTTMTTVSVADLLAYIVGLTIILFLWLQQCKRRGHPHADWERVGATLFARMPL
jgi:hypothetical protein